MRRDPLERLTIRAALVLGFGLVLGLWLFTGYAFTTRLAAAEARAAEVTRRYMQAQDALSTVRLQLNASSIALRDALLDPQPTTDSRHIRRLDDSYALIDAALNAYRPVLDTLAEPAEMQRLRTEIAEYRTVTLEVLAAYQADHSTPASRLLEEWITPRRAAAIAVSDEIRALNRRALLQHQIATADIHRAEEQSWLRRVGLALAATIGIAILAVLYAGRLEDRLRRERDKDALHARELQRLSARLVAAQEEERRTIARELHDEVGQVLSAIAVEAQVAERALPETDEAVRALGEVQQLANGATRVVRDLSHLLRPTMLDDLGLGAAIDWLLRGAARRHGLQVDLVQTGTPERLAPAVEVAAFRIVQEAVTNVARHADADRCTVRLVHQEGTLSLTVEDDGVGFDVSAGSRVDGRRGLGLVGIRERVLSLGGTFIVESREGQGTSLRVTLPLEPAEATGHVPAGADRPLGLELPRVAHG